jgi:hypothetical protein
VSAFDRFQDLGGLRRDLRSFTYVASRSFPQFRPWCSKSKGEDGDGQTEDGEHIRWKLRVKMMNILRGTMEASLLFCLGCSAVETLWAAMAILYTQTQPSTPEGFV